MVAAEDTLELISPQKEHAEQEGDDREAHAEAAVPAGASQQAERYVAVVAAFAAIGGMLFGYDLGIISGILAMPNFLDAMWPGSADDEELVDPLEEGFITTAFSIGCMLGATPFAAGRLMDALGRRVAIISAAVIFSLSGLMQAASSSLGPLYVARCVSGVAVGILSNVVPVYQSELAPSHVRGTLVGLFQLAITFGIMVAFWINFALAPLPSGWRLALALQAVPGAFLAVGMLGLPASPRWLALKGRLPEARAVLLRVRASSSVVDAEMAEIVASLRPAEDDFASDAGGAEGRAGAGGCAEIARERTPRRLVLTGVALQLLQQLSGMNSLMYYAPLIFASMGFKDSALLAQGVNGVVNFVATFPALALVDRVGRRALLLVGGAGMATAMLLAAITGTVSSVPDGEGGLRLDPEATTAKYAMLLACYLFVVCFAISWGPCVWIVCSEIFPLQIRGTAISVTTASNWCGNILLAQFVPAIQRAAPFGIFWIFGTTCLCGTLFVYSALPETKGVPMEAIVSRFEARWQRRGDGDAEELLNLRGRGQH